MSELKWVRRVGLEVEGGWEHPCKDKAIIADVSVKPLTDAERVDPRWRHYGELNTPGPPPGHPEKGGIPYEEVEKWLRDHHPDAMNVSCGFHVHVSVRDNDAYVATASRRFFDYFITRVTEWGKKQRFSAEHEFWQRLNGTSVNSRFCRKRFAPQDQLFKRKKEDDRRTMINWPWRMHKTIECRLFPSFAKVEQNIAAAKEWVSIVEDFLELTPPKKFEEECVVQCVGGTLVPNE